MATHSQHVQKYDKEHSTYIGLKLNNKTDKDILDYLEASEEPKQKTIKRLCRKSINEDQDKT